MSRQIAFALLLLLAGCQSAPPPAPICPTPQPMQCPDPIAPPPSYVPVEQSCPPVPSCPPMAIKFDAPPKIAEVRSNEARALDGKILVGEVEYATVHPGNLRLEARIDSGATTTSMHAVDIKSFERDGQRWVRFTTLTERGGEITLEQPRVRHVRIKGEGDDYERRPVVMLDIQIGSVRQKIEVSLTDRENYHYPLLIGRNFLRDHAVIDVSRKYVQGGRSEPNKNDSNHK